MKKAFFTLLCTIMFVLFVPIRTALFKKDVFEHPAKGKRQSNAANALPSSYQINISDNETVDKSELLFMNLQ